MLTFIQNSRCGLNDCLVRGFTHFLPHKVPFFVIRASIMRDIVAAISTWRHFTAHPSQRTCRQDDRPRARRLQYVIHKRAPQYLGRQRPPARRGHILTPVDPSGAATFQLLGVFIEIKWSVCFYRTIPDHSQ